MLDAPDLPAGNLQAKRILHVVGAAILGAGGRCLAARRAAHVPHPGCWEFPGGKVEPGEDPRRALEREIAEELGLAIVAGDFLGRGEAPISGGRTVLLDVYLAELLPHSPEFPPQLTDHDEVRWLTAAELGGLELAAADVPILPALAARLSGTESRY